MSKPDAVTTHTFGAALATIGARGTVSIAFALESVLGVTRRQLTRSVLSRVIPSERILNAYI